MKFLQFITMVKYICHFNFWLKKFPYIGQECPRNIIFIAVAFTCCKRNIKSRGLFWDRGSRRIFSGGYRYYRHPESSPGVHQYQGFYSHLCRTANPYQGRFFWDPGRHTTGLRSRRLGKLHLFPEQWEWPLYSRHQPRSSGAWVVHPVREGGTGLWNYSFRTETRDLS